MYGARSSGFWAPGPPAMTRVSSGPRSSALSAIPPQVEHGQDVGIADLVLERKAQDVELPERRERLQRIERDLVLPERGFEVGQRRKRPLARPAVGVHQAIEHLEAVMTHPQGVCIRERHADRPLDRAVILADRVQLPPEVLRRRLDVGQDPRGHVLFEGGVEHDRCLVRTRVGSGPARDVRCSHRVGPARSPFYPPDPPTESSRMARIACEAFRAILARSWRPPR